MLEYQRTPCSKHLRYRKVKRLQWDSNLQPRSLYRNTHLNGCVFIYELSGCGYEPRCSHLCCCELRKETEVDINNSIPCCVSITHTITMYYCCMQNKNKMFQFLKQAFLELYSIISVKWSFAEDRTYSLKTSTLAL